MELFGTACIIIAAFTLDCIIGDPHNHFHPVRFIGKGINLGIAVYRKTRLKSPAAQFIAGMVVSLFIIGLSYTITRIITFGFYRINVWVGITVEAILCYFLIAAKALKNESMKIYSCLTAGDIEAARKNLSFIVGRETKNLDQPAIVKATVETVSENLSDGVIAPLLFIFIGGAPLGMAYKAINTLDSMIGYKNEQFEYFGKFAARLDDVANFIPARFSALMMLLATVFCRLDTRSAARMYLRDRRNHKSPNAAQTESVCAGALGLCLGGDSYYHGMLVHKPTIGDNKHEPAPQHIIAANRLMYHAAINTVVIVTIPGVVNMFFRG